VEALRQCEVGLEAAIDVANADITGLLEQMQPTAVPAVGLDDLLPSQVTDGLHRVSLGHPVSIERFGDADQAVGAGRAGRQHAQCVVGVLSESHAAPSCCMTATQCVNSLRRNMFSMRILLRSP